MPRTKQRLIFTEWFRSEKERTKLAFAEISERTGIPLGMVKALSYGTCTPTEERIHLLAKAFQCEPPKAVVEKIVTGNSIQANSNIEPFAYALKKLRMGATISQTQLSLKIGRYSCFCTELEKCAKKVTYDDIVKIGNVLGRDDLVDQLVLSAKKSNQFRKEVSRSVVSQWVKTIRSEHGLEQVELSKKLDRANTFIKRIEADVASVNIENCKLIADYFNVPIPEEVQNFCVAEEQRRNQRFISYREGYKSPFGELLRKYRKEKGVLAKDLSQKIGKTSNYLNRVERGVRGIPAEVVQQLAEALGLDSVPDEWREAISASGQDISRNKSDIDDLPPLGKAIRQIRESKFLTITDMANILGMNQNTQYDDIEIGRVAVSDEVLFKIAKALDFNDIPDLWFALRRQSRQVPQDTSGRTAMLSALGKLIRAQRKKLGMSQKDLAKPLGYRGEWVHEIEYGRIRVSQELLQKICHALGFETVPQEYVVALESEARLIKHRLEYAPTALGEEHLTPQGWVNRKFREDAGLSIERASDEWNMTKHAIVSEEKPTEFSSWQERKAFMTAGSKQKESPVKKSCTKKMKYGEDNK